MGIGIHQVLKQLLINWQLEECCGGNSNAADLRNILPYGRESITSGLIDFGKLIVSQWLLVRKRHGSCFGQWKGREGNGKGQELRKPSTQSPSRKALDGAFHLQLLQKLALCTLETHTTLI